MAANKISTFDGFEIKLQKIEASYLNFDPITRVPNAKSRSQQSGFNGTLIITHHRLLWLFGSDLITQTALDQPVLDLVAPYRQVTHALFPEGLSIPFCNIYDVTVGKSGKRHLLAPKSLYKATFLIRLFTKDCCVHIFQFGQGSSEASAVISFLKVLQARLTIRYSICELYGDADLYQQLHRRLRLGRQHSQSPDAEQQQHQLVSNASAPSPLERAPAPALSPAPSPSPSLSPSEGLRASCFAAVCFGGRPSRAFARQLGWLDELKRLRCERAFRVVRLDHLCDSLPEYAVVPISSEESRVEAALASLAPHFSQRRLPTWCYALAKCASAAPDAVCLASASLWVASRPERAEHQFDSPHVPAFCEHIAAPSLSPSPSASPNVEAGTAAASATVDDRRGATPAPASRPPAQWPASSVLRRYSSLRVDSAAANSSRMRLADEVTELPFWENVMELFSAIEQTHLQQLSDAHFASISSTSRICVYDIVKLCPILTPCNVASAYERLHYLITKEFSEERESRAQFRDECLGELAGGWLDSERERRGGWCDLVAALLGLSARVAAELLSSRSVLVLEPSGRDLALALSALVELRLERSARTREGFARLVSKHLVALGHPFRTRLLGPPAAGSALSASSASRTSTTSFSAPNAPKSPSPSTTSSMGPSPLQLQLQPQPQATTPNSLFTFEQLDDRELSSRTAAGADDEQQEDARSIANSRISVLSTVSTVTSSFGITTRTASDATCQSRTRDKNASRTPKGLKSFMSKFKNAALTPAKLIRSAAFASTLSLPSSKKLSDSLLSIISIKPLEDKPEESGCFTPVLLLFLDCVRQLLEDYPAAFEFTEVYLAALWESALTGLASEFAFDSLEQRREAFRTSAFGHMPFEEALSMADALPPHASLSACGLKELHRPAGAGGDAAAAPLDEAYQLAAHLSSAFHLPTRYRFDDERFRSELERSHCNPLNILFDADRVPYIELLVRSSLEATPIDSFLIDPSAPYCSTHTAQDSSLCLSCSSFNDVHNELLVDAISHPLRVRVWDELFCRWIAQLWPVPSLQEPANPQLQLVAQRLCKPSRQTLADFPEHAVAPQPHMQLFVGARRAQLATLLRDAVSLAPPTPTGQMRQQWPQIDDASSSSDQSPAVTPSASSERFASAAAPFANNAVRVGGSASASSPANSSGSTLTPSPEQMPADADEKPKVVKQFQQQQQQSPRHVGSSIAPVIKCVSKASVSTSSGVSAVSSSARGPPALFLPTTAVGSTACHSDSSTSDEPFRDNQNPTHKLRQGSLVRRLVSEFSRQASVPSLSKTDVETHAAPLSRTTSSITQSRRAYDTALSTPIPTQLTCQRTSQATAARAAANAATREFRQTERFEQTMGQGDGDGRGGRRPGLVVLPAHRDSPLHNRRQVQLPFALSIASSSCSSPPSTAASAAALDREEGRSRDVARPAARLQAPSIASNGAAASNSSASDGLDDAKLIRPTPSAAVGSLLNRFSPYSTNL